MTAADYLEQAATRLQRDEQGASWVYHQVMSDADRRAFDAWLVEIEHPYASQPGTTWQRFTIMAAARASELNRELWQLVEADPAAA